MTSRSLTTVRSVLATPRLKPPQLFQNIADIVRQRTGELLPRVAKG